MWILHFIFFLVSRISKEVCSFCTRILSHSLTHTQSSLSFLLFFINSCSGFPFEHLKAQKSEKINNFLFCSLRNFLYSKMHFRKKQQKFFCYFSLSFSLIVASLTSHKVLFVCLFVERNIKNICYILIGIHDV